MDRKRLARLAYNTAVDRIARDASLTASEKKARWFRISNAYEARKSQLDLAAFLGFHRLDRVLGNLAREHAEGRVGATPVRAEAPVSTLHQNNEAAA